MRVFVSHTKLHVCRSIDGPVDGSHELLQRIQTDFGPESEHPHVKWENTPPHYHTSFGCHEGSFACRITSSWKLTSGDTADDVIAHRRGRCDICFCAQAPFVPWLEGAREPPVSPAKKKHSNEQTWTHDGTAPSTAVSLRRLVRNCAKQATVDKKKAFRWSSNPFVFNIKVLKLISSVMLCMLWLFSKRRFVVVFSSP